MAEAVKHDTGKLRYDLLPFAAVDRIVRVLNFGAGKYAPNNWQRLPDFEERYIAAMFRHLSAHQQGELTDAESGLSHLSHAACCMMFLLWKENEDERMARAIEQGSAGRRAKG